MPTGSVDTPLVPGASVELARRRVGVRGGMLSPNGMGDAAWRIIMTEWTAFTNRAFPDGGGAFCAAVLASLRVVAASRLSEDPKLEERTSAMGSRGPVESERRIRIESGVTGSGLLGEGSVSEIPSSFAFSRDDDIVPARRSVRALMREMLSLAMRKCRATH